MSRLIVTLLVSAGLFAALATGACATVPSGVVASGQVYYCWSDWGVSFWGPMFYPEVFHIESDPGDWLYAVQSLTGDYEPQVQFGTNTTHSGPLTYGAYEGYFFGVLSAGMSEFDFDVFAVTDPSMDHWGSPLLRLELWEVMGIGGGCWFDNLLWASNGPWSIEPQHAHVTLSEPYGISAYAFRLTIVPEPESFICLALPLIGFLGWQLRTRRYDRSSDGMVQLCSRFLLCASSCTPAKDGTHEKR